ncbi:hypothetical protein D5086_016417 [Populus alba]|uniref:Uncharacterized protein n=1 Tax=Populus alba TaxID=43335 RepID=A0ACC4BUJ6_POPAL
MQRATANVVKSRCLEEQQSTAAALSITAASLNDDDNQHSSTKLLTFLGKGGSGKTTSAVFAAQVLLEPLGWLKQADSSLKMTQGVLEGLGQINANQSNEDNFEIIIYDGASSDETLRMIGAASKARLYLKYLRNFAEKTDLGRLAGPSLLRLVDEALSLSDSKYNLNGKMSTEMWDSLERILECRGGSELVAEAGDQRRVICFATKIQGKVGGAKFVDRSLVITVRRIPAIQSHVDFIASHQRYAT